MNHALVIGVGNTLRGDDGAGVIAAGRARDWRRGWTSCVHELQPEHAETVAGMTGVILVDASLGRHPARDTAQPAGAAASTARPHPVARRRPGAGTGRSYREHPEALLLEIPALSMEFGDGLTPVTSACVEEALVHIRREASLSRTESDTRG